MEIIQSYQRYYQEINSTKENLRPIEEIIDDIKELLAPVKEESLLLHTMLLINELSDRKTSPLYTHISSPMRQSLYLIDVFYSIERRKGKLDMDDKRWNKIALLLNEIEMTYFVNIGFPNGSDLYHDERDQKVHISLATFVSFFNNAVLRYEEQTQDRIIRYFKPYDDYIQSNYGFKIEEALIFCEHLRKANNKKFLDITLQRTFALQTYQWYVQLPNEERGFNTSINLLEEFAPPPLVSLFIHDQKELQEININSQSLQCIIDFFTYDKDAMKGKTIYYADKRHIESHPLILGKQKCLFPLNKFLFESLYFRLDEALTKSTSTSKYLKNKSLEFEKKVVNVFKRFFPSKTKIFTNYSVDGVAENDLLIIYENVCIIVEIKNCGFRAPFRDPIKSYSRIKSDFQKAIQLGYNQCKRVEKILLGGQDVNIYDAINKNKKLYHLKNKNMQEVRSIIVTDLRYGRIQTDLGLLLEKADEDLYPWAASIDDIEAFLLLMRKTLKGIAPARFIEFLDYRERFQEHILSDDELEICGWYLTNREQFKEYADRNQTTITNTDMVDIFVAHYFVGLGFKDELDIEIKKQHKLPEYSKTFEMSDITSDMIKGKA